MICLKCRLSLISFLDVDIIISPLKVNLGEYLSTLEFVNELGDEWEGIFVLARPLLKFSIILYWAQ